MSLTPGVLSSPGDGSTMCGGNRYLSVYRSQLTDDKCSPSFTTFDGETIIDHEHGRYCKIQLNQNTLVSLSQYINLSILSIA